MGACGITSQRRHSGCCPSIWRCVMATAIRSERPNEPCQWPTLDSMEGTLRGARDAVTAARHVAKDFAANAELEFRRHPVGSVGVAVIAGAVVGSLVGFGAGWFMRSRT